MPAMVSLLFLPIVLYAEIHYRFRYFPSFLRKREPEVIADAPHRLEPGKRLPVLVLVKDAHWFPCELQQITIVVRTGETVHLRQDCLDGAIRLDGRVHSFVYYLDVSTLRGWIELDVLFTLRRGDSSRRFRNDNYRTSSHKPLRVFLADDPLPRFPHLHLGDPHVHSIATTDQVEFGAPLRESVQLAHALGLSFFCVTDHSYDLDDSVESYLRNDPSLPKWRQQQDEIDLLNRVGAEVVVVRGEEVTCRNGEDRNVHLLLFGQREFVPGSGDSAERWLRTRSENAINEVLQRKSAGAIAFAAHAKEEVPLLQRILLRRGEWTEKDLASEGLTGLQIFNGKHDLGSLEGMKSWTSRLLAGRRAVAIAGNDAHGNFNSFRQIRIPFVMIREETNHLFGRMRTGIFVEGPLTEEGILRALSEGRAIMTDGPVATIVSSGPASETLRFGLSGVGSHIVTVLARSSSEFGPLASITLLAGTVGSDREHVVYRARDLHDLDFKADVEIGVDRCSYVRVAVETDGRGSFDGSHHFCYTNPLWFAEP